MALGFRTIDRAVAHLLGDPRMILGQLFDLSVANEVGSAVADVRDHGLVVFDERPGHRRTHAAQLFVLADAARQLMIGHGHGGGHSVPVERNAGIEGERPGLVAVAGRVPDESMDGLTDELRRHVAARMAAHAVDDQEQAEFLVRNREILVPTALPTGVGVYTCIDTHHALGRPRGHGHYSVRANHVAAKIDRTWSRRSRPAAAASRPEKHGGSVTTFSPSACALNVWAEAVSRCVRSASLITMTFGRVAVSKVSASGRLVVVSTT